MTVFENKTALCKEALRGNPEAQKQATSLGIILPCPCCKGKAEVVYQDNKHITCEYRSNIYKASHPGYIKCFKCGLTSKKMSRVSLALRKWNTRPVW